MIEYVCLEDLLIDWEHRAKFSQDSSVRDLYKLRLAVLYSYNSYKNFKFYKKGFHYSYVVDEVNSS